MKQLKSKSELLDVSLVSDIHLIIHDLQSAIYDLKPKDAFMEFLGGDVFILENFYDFAQVTFFDPDTSRTRNLLCDYGQFDMCESLGMSGIYKIMTITSNAGGAVYYVPKKLAEANPFVALSDEATN
jgi:hypothetical protein